MPHPAPGELTYEESIQFIESLADFAAGLASRSAPVIQITLLASVTLLPALLGFVGRNIDKLGDRKSTRLNSSHT